MQPYEVFSKYGCHRNVIMSATHVWHLSHAELTGSVVEVRTLIRPPKTSPFQRIQSPVLASTAGCNVRGPRMCNTQPYASTFKLPTAYWRRAEPFRPRLLSGPKSPSCSCRMECVATIRRTIITQLSRTELHLESPSLVSLMVNDC